MGAKNSRQRSASAVQPPSGSGFPRRPRQRASSASAWAGPAKGSSPTLDLAATVPPHRRPARRSRVSKLFSRFGASSDDITVISGSAGSTSEPSADSLAQIGAESLRHLYRTGELVPSDNPKSPTDAARAATSSGSNTPQPLQLSAISHFSASGFGSADSIDEETSSDHKSEGLGHAGRVPPRLKASVVAKKSWQFTGKDWVRSAPGMAPNLQTVPATPDSPETFDSYGYVVDTPSEAELAARRAALLSGYPSPSAKLLWTAGAPSPMSQDSYPEESPMSPLDQDSQPPSPL